MVKRTVCCQCEARCGVLVELDASGAPSAVRGDPEHPLTHGFTCVRGRAGAEAFHDPRRLDLPLRRTGPRGAGDFEEVSWDTALDDIAERLGSIRQSSGAEAVAYLNGTQFAADGWFGHRLMHRFGSPNAGGTGVMCGGPQFAAGALTFGFASAFPDVTPGVTELVILWGQRPAASAVPYWQRILAAVRAGARLVVVDPRPTVETRRADQWLAPRPGTDAALALAMLSVILGEGLHDEEFTARWTLGLEALAARAAEYEPERSAAITGVAAEQVRDLARSYATTAAAVLSPGTPNGQGRNALAAERAFACLIAVTGKLDRPGANRLAGPDPDVGSEVSYDAYEELPPAQRRKRLGADRFRLHDEGVELLSKAARPVWHGIPYPITRRSLGGAHPIAVFEAIAGGSPYQVEALLLQHHNAVGAYSGTELVRRALLSEKLDLLVVHELVMTPTALLADYVLPAASWMEKPFLLSQGWGSPVVAGEQVIPPRAERRSDYELCRDLGRRLGQDWPERVEDVFDAWLAGAGTSFAGLLERPQRMLAGPAGRARHAQIDPETAKPYGFATPSGRIELRSTVLERLGYDPLPAYQPIPELEPGPDYPLYLMTGTTRIDATHQDHRHVASLRARHPDPQVELDPETARAHGIAEADWVRIITPRGAIRQRAVLVPGLGADRVSAERWWYPERKLPGPDRFDVLGSNVNSLTANDLDLCDPAYGALPYRVAHCRIEPGEPLNAH